jgi:type IV pilus assembly protein PilM
MVERVLGSVRDAGLRVDGIDLSAFGMMRAIAHPEDGSAVYLSVGGMTNLSVADAGMCLFTRVSGGGLESIAVDLAERRGLTIDHARAWLGHVGVATPLEEIEGDPGIVADARDTLLAGIHRISSDVRTSLEFHQMQSETTVTAPVEKVILTGSALAIPGIGDAIGGQLSLPVEERVIAVDSERTSLAPGAVTVAAGLAIEELVA